MAKAGIPAKGADRFAHLAELTYDPQPFIEQSWDQAFASVAGAAPEDTPIAQSWDRAFDRINPKYASGRPAPQPKERFAHLRALIKTSRRGDLL